MKIVPVWGALAGAIGVAFLPTATFFERAKKDSGRFATRFPTCSIQWRGRCGPDILCPPPWIWSPRILLNLSPPNKESFR
jgi:hypothetical protein